MKVSAFRKTHYRITERVNVKEERFSRRKQVSSNIKKPTRAVAILFIVMSKFNRIILYSASLITGQKTKTLINASKYRCFFRRYKEK